MSKITEEEIEDTKRSVTMVALWILTLACSLGFSLGFGFALLVGR